METGLLVMAFLPGDALLFTAGAFCAGVQNNLGQTADLNLTVLLLLLCIAAVTGDSLNYYLGKKLGVKLLNFKIGNKTIVNPKYIQKTNEFYNQYGSKTIIIARFLPIIRTFAPFYCRHRKYALFKIYSL
ncbi:MAG: VTT domain-containing protein [Polaribacter sp.]|nr:VTT domain-containing protein [Polaribacter sp.]